MIQEKISPEVIEIERQEQEEKQEIQQQQPRAMNSKGGSENNGSR
jgi:hypothetical protein